MTDRTARRRLATEADLVSVSVRGKSGFVKSKFADRIEAQIAAHRADVERICAEPAKPRGRPKKETMK